MTDHNEKNPWMCHVCDYTATGESTACSVCYKTTCGTHLTHRSVYNKESGLYELVPVCIYCAAGDALH